MKEEKVLKEMAAHSIASDHIINNEKPRKTWAAFAKTIVILLECFVFFSFYYATVLFESGEALPAKIWTISGIVACIVIIVCKKTICTIKKTNDLRIDSIASPDVGVKKTPFDSTIK